MLEISSDKVAFVILKAREFDADVTIPDEPSSGIDFDADVTIPDESSFGIDIDADATNPGESSSAIDTEDDAAANRADRSSDTTRSEVAEFISGLNEDEQADLVALVWIGRGTYSAEEFEEAVEMAKAERTSLTEDYLLGTPLLADYLEAGLEKLGYTVEDIERDVT